MKDLEITFPFGAKHGDTIKLRQDYPDGFVIREYMFVVKREVTTTYGHWVLMSIDSSGIRKEGE